jgi:hypothetical protein
MNCLLAYICKCLCMLQGVVVGVTEDAQTAVVSLSCSQDILFNIYYSLYKLKVYCPHVYEVHLLCTHSIYHSVAQCYLPQFVLVLVLSIIINPLQTLLVLLQSHVALYAQVKLADDKLISGRLNVGCDGINSVCRAAVTGVSTSDSKARHCGEICYR